jgi:3-oxoacyl-ACP reductase-like protein
VDVLVIFINSKSLVTAYTDELGQFFPNVVSPVTQFVVVFDFDGGEAFDGMSRLYICSKIKLEDSCFL